jgi:SAM-dependent methyltransferase
LAISSTSHFDELGFTHFTATSYPEFDICQETLDRKFDLIIADQVFEHVKFPARAARNVYQMLAPNGWFILATPFLIKVHRHPIDCSRWTVDGMKYFLAESGFDENAIVAQSWGNRAYISWHLWLPVWPPRGFSGSLKNEPDFPVVVWAFAQKKGEVT